MLWSLSMRQFSRAMLAVVVLAVGLLAGLSVQRAEAQPVVTPDFLCASMWTGELSYRPAGCPAGHQTLDLTAGPVTVCGNMYTKQLRRANAGGLCPAGTVPVQLGAPSETLACANPFTGKVTWISHPAQPCNGILLDWVIVVADGACNNCPQAIPEVGSAVGTASTAGLPGTITDVNVTLDISHTSTGDLEIFLQSPTGTIVMLYDDQCPFFSVDLDVTLDDEAATPIGLVCPPAGGTFQPTPGMLSSFDGENPNGVWTLTVNDNFADDEGVLNTWSLDITSS